MPGTTPVSYLKSCPLLSFGLFISADSRKDKDDRVLKKKMLTAVILN